MYGAEEQRRKRCLSLKGPKQNAVGSEADTSWGSLEIPTIWPALVLRGRGCFMVVELSIERMAPASIRTGRDSSPIWRNVSLNWLRGRIRKSPCSSSELCHWELGEHWKGSLEGQRHVALEFVIIISPKSCLFVIITETRRILVLFRCLCLLQLIFKNFGGLPWGWLV